MPSALPRLHETQGVAGPSKVRRHPAACPFRADEDFGEFWELCRGHRRRGPRDVRSTRRRHPSIWPSLRPRRQAARCRRRRTSLPASLWAISRSQAGQYRHVLLRTIIPPSSMWITRGSFFCPILPSHLRHLLNRASVYGLRKNVYRGGCLPSLGMSIALSIRSRRRPNLAGLAAERCGELDSTGFHVVPDLFGRVAPASGAAQDGHDPHRLALEVLFGFTCRIQEMSRQQGCCDSPLRLSSGQSLAHGPHGCLRPVAVGHRGEGAPGRPNSMAAPRTSPMPRPRSVPRWRSFYPR